MTRVNNVKQLSVETLKGADVVFNVKLFLGDAGWLFFDHYVDPADTAQPPVNPPIVEFRQWQDDSVFYTSPIAINSSDPRVAVVSLPATQMVLLRTSRIYFSCVGARKTDGVREVLFRGTINTLR